MSKRVYIAVGTVGVKSLGNLFQRYQEADLFSDPEYADDQFIGLETDHGTVNAFSRLATTNRNVVGIRVVSEPHVQGVRDLVKSFRPTWDKNRDIPTTGVGGDRTLSLSTLVWTRADQGVLKTRLRSLTSGLDDVVILIGTAFGGTSTGMFWNVASWIRKNLPQGGPQGALSRPQFFAFAILPATNYEQVGRYPWARNLCGFMQDMQTLDTTTRLRSTVSLNRDIPFEMPDFVSYDDSSVQHGTIPLWVAGTQATPENRLSEHSYLPVDRLFLVPPETGAAQANGGRFSRVILEEQLFLFGALDVWKRLRCSAQTVDLFTQTTQAGYANPDLAFGGFHFVAGATARRSILVNQYWRGLLGELQSFCASGVHLAGEDAKAALAKALSDAVFEGDFLAFVGQRMIDFEKVIDNVDKAGVEARQTRVRDILRQVDETLSGAATTQWRVFHDFVDIATRLKGIRFSLSDLEDVYKAVRNDILSKAQRVDSVRGTILDNIAKCERTAKNRSGRGLVKSLGPGAVSAVQKEVRNAFEAAEKALWGQYIHALIAKTLTIQLQDETLLEQEFSTVRRDFGRLAAELEAQRPNLGRGMRRTPSCISNVDVENIALGGHFEPDRSELLVVLLKAFLAAPGEPRTGILQSGERACLEKFLEEDRRLKAASPFRNLPVRFDEGCRAFSPVMAVSDSSEWHDHFWYVCGAVENTSWQRLGTFANAFGNTFKTLLPEGVPYAPQDNVAPATLHGDFFDYHDFTNELSSVQGAWLGTLKLDGSIREILRNTYQNNGVNLHSTDSDIWNNETQAGNPPRNLQRLPESIALGCILGAIARKANALLADRLDGTARVRIEKAGIDMTFQPMNVGTYFTNGEMTSFPMEWMPKLMKWIEGSFWTDTQATELAEKLKIMHYQTLARMDLTIPEDIHQGLVGLAKALDRFVFVQ